MLYQAFVDQVQKRALLDSKEETVKAIRATLTTLGERIVSAEAEELAGRLPPEAATTCSSLTGASALTSTNSTGG